MQNIQFPYHGWVVKVTPESDGWTAHIQHPRQFEDNEFIPLAHQFDCASDAVQACMYWAETATAQLAIREFLNDEEAGDRLSADESCRLFLSIGREAWRKRVPSRAAKEAQ
ncbi:MAG: hypothetical protein KME12_23450 [Trichocoleus desertorum ATA4-8-CV12]|jgi:hypothetical protein|nr:hypothetical protein [Trichocoleus desertorum ATA4-8-CV12]